MLYNRLSDDELERAVYIDPTNAAARAELLVRVPGLLDNNSDELADVEMELEIARADHKGEMDVALQELADSEAHSDEITKELDAANERIAALTSCADLV